VRLLEKFGLLRRKTSLKGKQENIFHYSVLKLIFTHENTAPYKFYHQTTFYALPSSAILTNMWTQYLFLQPQLTNKQPALLKLFQSTNSIFPYFAVFISYCISWSSYWLLSILSLTYTYNYINPVTLHHILVQQNLNHIYSCEGNSRLPNGTLAMNILKCAHLVYNTQFSLTESSLHSGSDMVSMLIICSIIYRSTGWKLYKHMQP
jgi:hypothetical protein